MNPQWWEQPCRARCSGWAKLPVSMFGEAGWRVLPEHLLEVRGLKTVFPTRDGLVHAVDGVDFHLDPGETLGIVGESGSGKSVTVLSVMRLLQRPGRVDAGQVLFKGRDLLRCSEREMQEVRGQEIAMIF